MTARAEDDDRAQIAAAILQAILIVLGVAALVYAVVPDLRSGVWSLVGPIPPLLGLRWLLSRGDVDLAVALLLVLVVGLISGAAFTSGGFPTGVPILLSIGPVLGSLLAGPRVGLALTAGGLLVTTGVYVLGATDVILMVDAEPRTIRFAMNVVTTVLIGIATSWTIERMRTSAAVAERQAEALARARDYSDALVQCMAEPVLVADGAGRILQANEAALSLLAAEPGLVVGRSLSTFVAVPPGHARTPTPTVRVEGQLHPVHGPPIPADVTTARMVDPEGEPREIVVASDARNRVEVRERMEEAAAAAVAAGQAKSAFLAGMSHELRTPLNAILGFSELLAEELDESRAADAERIHRSARQLLSLVNDVLDLSKIEAGKMEVLLERLSIGGLVERVAAELRPLAAERENALQIEVSAEATWVSDERKLRHILENLLSNAIKFTHRGEIRAEVRQGEQELLVRVADSGIGIAPDRLEGLFQPFVQGDSTPQRRYGGSGLGLAVSAEFVRLLSGTIEVESELGRGSTFTVRLPRVGP